MKEGANKNYQMNDFLDDRRLSLALMASFVVLTIQYFILIVFNLIDSSSATIVQTLSKVFVGIMFLYALPVVIKRNYFLLIAIYLTATSIFLINYVFYPDNQEHIVNIIFPFFFMCLPAFIYSLNIKNWNIFEQTMKKASLIVLLFGSILGLFILSGNATLEGYSISLSYYLLLPTVVNLNEWFNKPSIKIILMSTISIILIVLLGSRGAILCIIGFLILKLLKYNLFSTYKRFFSVLVIIITTVFLYFNINSVLLILSRLLMNYGINSRTLNSFMEEDINLSGREDIYKDMLSSISVNPIFGIGITGDREIIDGGYSHNIFLELLSGFGVIIGGIISITFLSILVYSLIIQNKRNYDLLIIWISLGFIHLMVSGSYLTDIKFWILLGLFVSYIVTNTKQSNIEHLNKKPIH